MNGQDRAELLQLLNGSDKALRRIEEAIVRFNADLPTELKREQTPTQIAEDAKSLHHAIQTIISLIATNGDAWLTFKDFCAADGVDSIRALNHLAEALDTSGIGSPGELLLAASEMAADDLKPIRKRPKSAAKAVRFSLVFHTAQAASEAGVLISRSSTTFQKIMSSVFRAANIMADPEHDIREFLKATAN